MQTTPILIVIVILLAGGAFWWTKARPAEVAPAATLSPLPTETSALNNSTPMPLTVSQSSIAPINSEVNVTMKTSMGDIALRLDGAKAPLAVGNFVQLAKAGFYDGITFHRVIPGFMIQTGDPLSKDPSQRARHGMGGPGYDFPNEDNDRKFIRGAIGMANAGRDTNGSQFFIMVADNSQLNGGYTNFGEVTDGMDAADKIVAVKRDANDNPLEPVVIKEVVVSE